MAEFAQKAARKTAAPRKGPVRLGMMRHLLVAIDCSDPMNCQDLKPTRFLCTLKVRIYIKIVKLVKCYLNIRRHLFLYYYFNVYILNVNLYMPMLYKCVSYCVNSTLQLFIFPVIRKIC